MDYLQGLVPTEDDVVVERLVSDRTCQRIRHTRRRLEDCDAAKVTAIKRALAAKRGVRRIARDLKTGVGTVLRIKSELAA